ncbi:hypothetical protein [Clostridium sp.]
MVNFDIQGKIDIHRIRLETYLIEKDYLLKMMMGGPGEIQPISYEAMPHGQGAQTVTLDRQWDAMSKLVHMIELEEWAIEGLEKQLKEMKLIIDSSDCIDAKVKYLRDVQHMHLQDIAIKLTYTLDYIKEISCRNPRKPTI